MHDSDPVPATDATELLRVARTFPWLPPLEVGAGWAALLWDMAEDIEDLVGRPALLEGRVRLRECRAAHAGLRLTVSRLAVRGLACERALCAVLDRAEQHAARACERCGRPGTANLHDSRRATLCEGHRVNAARPVRRTGGGL